MIRRGTRYGPMLPEGVLEDDGADRGIIFVFAGAHLKRRSSSSRPSGSTTGSHRRTERTRPARPRGRSHQQLHDPRTADPPPAAGSSSVRGHPRRRVLLRPELAGAALAGRARVVTPREEPHVATTPTRTDRWKALDFAPPAADAEEPDSPVLVDYHHSDQIALITLNRPHADN